MLNDHESFKKVSEVNSLKEVHHGDEKMFKNVQELKPHQWNVEVYGVEQLDEAFVSSIKTSGILEPIVIKPDGTIISGHRRWGAAQQLGMTEVPVRVVEYKNELEEMESFIERNRYREKTFSQRAKEAEFIEEIEKKKAKERQAHGQTAPGKNASANISTSVNGKSRKAVAEQVGFGSGATYQKVKKIVESAKKGDEQAKEIVEKLDKKEISISKAHEEIKKQEEKQKDVEREVGAPNDVDTAETLVLIDAKGREYVINKPKNDPVFDKTDESIGLARWTWNPVTGCHQGCTYCYAREIAEKNFKNTFPAGFRPLLRYERLDAPKYSKPLISEKDPLSKRVFVCSMGDLFAKWVPDEWIDKVLVASRQVPEFEYLFLTRNPRRYFNHFFFDNSWLGATITNQSQVGDALYFFNSIAEEGAFKGVKWLSFEPLLEPIKLDLSNIDFIVIGAQTETVQKSLGKIPAVAPNLEWVVDLINQANSVGCSIYLKNNLLGKVSGKMPGMNLIQEPPRRRTS